MNADPKKELTATEKAGAKLFANLADKLNTILNMIEECNDLSRALEVMGFGVGPDETRQKAYWPLHMKRRNFRRYFVPPAPPRDYDAELLQALDEF